MTDDQIQKLVDKFLRNVQMPPLFIDGYLTQLFEAGREPDYGYPKNGLPNTTGGDMEIVTGFLSVSPSDSQE